MVKERTDSKKADRTTPAPSSAAILVVDDHRAAAEGLAELLRADGYETYVAFDVVSGLSILEDEAVDVVIADLQIGSMGGMAVVRTVRDAAIGAKTEIPGTVILADRDADGFLAGRAGADSWLRKPFGGFELRDAVNRLVGAGGGTS